MKRNKIKSKYLKKFDRYEMGEINEDEIVSVDSMVDSMMDKVNKLDRLENSFIGILKAGGLIFLLYFWINLIIYGLYYIFGFDYSTLNTADRIVVLFGCDFLFLLFIIFIFRDTLIKDFKNFFNENFLSHIDVSFKYWFAGVIVMIISNCIISVFVPSATAANEEGVRELIDLSSLFMAFELSIYAPLTEELIFRKSFRDITNNKYIYILLSGIVFGALHVIGSIECYYDLLYIIPYSALGIAFAALYYKTDNIFSTISMHAVHNTLSLLLYLFI